MIVRAGDNGRKLGRWRHKSGLNLGAFGMLENPAVGQKKAGDEIPSAPRRVYEAPTLNKTANVIAITATQSVSGAPD